MLHPGQGKQQYVRQLYRRRDPETVKLAATPRTDKPSGLPQASADCLRGEAGGVDEPRDSFAHACRAGKMQCIDRLPPSRQTHVQANGDGEQIEDTEAE
jgi:hypothetical protein